MKAPIVYTDFTDEMGEAEEVAIPAFGAIIDMAQYRQKVAQYLGGHLDHPVIGKLRENLPTDASGLRQLEKSLLTSCGSR